MKRYQMMAASLFLMAGILALAASPASARLKYEKYQGPAPGSVTCALSVKVKYSPAMTNHGGRATHASVKLSHCHASDPRVVVRSAKLNPGSSTAALTATPLNCQPDNHQPPALVIKWNGTFTETQGSTHFRGKASYLPSFITENGEKVITNMSNHVGLGLPGPGNTASVNSSFSNPSTSTASLYTTMTQTAFTHTCARKGFHLLKLRGTITVG